MAEYVKVANRSEIPPGTGKTVEVGERPIAVFNCDGTYYAIDDTCPHQGGPLGEGELEGCLLTCPWHAWQFDVRTGDSVTDDSKVAVYECKVEGDQVLVAV